MHCVHSAIGQADIVKDRVDLTITNQAPYFALNLGKFNPGLLNSCPRRCTDVETHLAGIDLREKILSEHGKEKERNCHENEKESDGTKGK